MGETNIGTNAKNSGETAESGVESAKCSTREKANTTTTRGKTGASKGHTSSSETKDDPDTDTEMEGSEQPPLNIRDTEMSDADAEVEPSPPQQKNNEPMYRIDYNFDSLAELYSYWSELHMMSEKATTHTIPTKAAMSKVISVGGLPLSLRLNLPGE
ncbi:hypothetical protein SARC_16024 [Sphaeroforma arctica JP610]|uniref:Uncharacterized protein n=1 Tax=Sphaeroforma arctica JP610 TaxID=667725 RepID=A0A0L0F496_9EUKA|nr:hypothetical protein SARC_16024 [Sphaeroforma arctica JP610]KNC71436.1 hypothetical protein SARC_16024 [Sphaeroforma arctica JP610]|eukprot:XP_014145338.1 hypothetical protein SARC_16024 [Sphaeroforma arctica JP610]